MRILALAGVVLSVFATGSVNAAEPEAQYSPDEFVKAILTGPQPCPKGASLTSCEANPKTRRFTLAGEDDAARRRSAPISARFAQPSKPVVRSADVLVTFALGSAEITEQGKANLQSIAAGLNKAALAELAFEVAGFTDASGPADVNQALSRRRADAVKAYLVSLNVKEARLVTAGYGSDHLIDPADPTSEANRRVELHRMN